MATAREQVERLILEKLEGLGVKPQKWLTRKLVIDTEGNIHSFWGEGEEIQHHCFNDIHTSISEHLHVLEGYRGDLIQIRGQGIVIPGEKQRTEQFISRLHGLIEQLMTSTFLSPDQERCLRQDIDWIVAQIGQSTDANKQLAKAKLEQLMSESLVKERNRSKPELAVPASEAATELLRRYIDIQDKTSGTVIRLQRLLKEHYLTLKIIVNVRQQLGKHLNEFSNGQVPEDERLRQIAREICDGKANLVTTLERVLVKPYVDRIRSAEILGTTEKPGRLRRAKTHLSKYFRTHSQKDLKTFYNTLHSLYQKLATPYREYQAQRRKRPIVDEEGRLKV